MPDESRQMVTLYTERSGESLATARSALDAALPTGRVGQPDDSGMLDVEVVAGSREEALAAVRDAIASAGVDDHFTFPETTGTHYRLESER